MQVNELLDNLNVISEKIFKSVDTQIYKILDDIVEIGPDLLTKEPLKNIFFSDKLNGIIIIANSFILFYIIYYILIQLISIYNGKKIPNIYYFIMKVIIIFTLSNNSYFLCNESLDFFKSFSSAINTYGNSITNNNLSFEGLKENILSIDDFMKNDLLTLDGLIKGIISFGIVSVLINFSIRYVVVIFLTLISPFAIISYISGSTSGFFKSWIKMYIVNMMVQVVVKCILIIPLVYKDINSIMYKIILVGSVYLIYKITTFTKELFMNIQEFSEIVKRS